MEKESGVPVMDGHDVEVKEEEVEVITISDSSDEESDFDYSDDESVVVLEPGAHEFHFEDLFTDDDFLPHDEVAESEYESNNEEEEGVTEAENEDHEDTAGPDPDEEAPFDEEKDID